MLHIGRLHLIRPAKRGLENYVFIGNAEAGGPSALLYTLIANCRVQGINGERYLEDVLRRLPATALAEHADALTPAMLAPVIRTLQPRPALRVEPTRGDQSTAA